MSEQDNSTRLDEGEAQGSGLLRSVEPIGGASYSMSASDTVDGGTDAGKKDTDGTDKTSDSDGTDGGDTDTTDGGDSDADGTDFGDDSDASDQTADADGTDS
ncbi:MAG: hypothetical protein QOF61_972 [Acidobacteriota bacterium]|nr:hypothetical protein [Acidobacteriota bacterium]